MNNKPTHFEAAARYETIHPQDFITSVHLLRHHLACNEREDDINFALLSTALMRQPRTSVKQESQQKSSLP